VIALVVTNRGAWMFLCVIVILVLLCVAYIVKEFKEDHPPKCDCFNAPRRRGEEFDGRHYLGCAYIQWRLIDGKDKR